MNTYRKNPKISDIRKCAVIILKVEQNGFSIVYCIQRCRGNCKQCRPWSDCSSRSSLIWVCTVCPDLSVRKLKKHYDRPFWVSHCEHITFCFSLPRLRICRHMRQKYIKSSRQYNCKNILAVDWEKNTMQFVYCTFIISCIKSTYQYHRKY